MGNYAVVIGSVNIDLISQVEEMPSVGATVSSADFSVNQGGKGANQAVALAASGVPIYLLGKVGEDEFANLAKKSLLAKGVNLSKLLVTDKAQTGTALILVDRDGNNIIVVNKGANEYLTCRDLDAHRQLIENAGIVLMQLEIPMEVVEYGVELAYSAGVPVLLDPAPPVPLTSALLKRVKYLAPNQHEAEALSGIPDVNKHNAEIVTRELLKMGPEVVVLKLGAEGGWVATSTEGKFIAGHKVRAVDTTGAGDCFAGAFAARILAGDDPFAAAIYANQAAALSVTRFGAATAPSVEEIISFAREQGIKL